MANSGIWHHILFNTWVLLFLWNIGNHLPYYVTSCPEYHDLKTTAYFYKISHDWAVTVTTDSMSFYPTRSLKTSSGERGINTAAFWYKFSGLCTDSYNCLYTAAITSNDRRCTVERWTLLSNRPTCGSSNTSGITRKVSNLLWNLKYYTYRGSKTKKYEVCGGSRSTVV